MPQATEELRQLWHYNSDTPDYSAEHFLINERGFMLTRRWTWVPPVPMDYGMLDEKEYSAILYLVQEWDYGGLE